ncbi:rhombosortase [Shewanella litorisediminis]|uniref:Rhombosortase n=1 Tax=Shewanella litorisediminis TaxID=1173586 RepID=A0ABX7G8E1_9GAMM|nr:rhombosortase [Shewanella litorisediminis]MCL2919302.1 rhombosortase [Shewanella litorisediminis]QRH03641.1 rhombosortase [Shewanella litorisediminis]
MVGAVLTLLCTVLYFLPVDGKLNWQRQLIGVGEYWRLISGNLLHTNHWHLLMNLAGFWVILSLHHFHYRIAGLLLLLLILCLGEGVGLYLFYPSLHSYVGLSGILHGFFGFGAIMDIKRGITSGWLLLIGLCLKVGYEQLYGASSDVTQMIGARVATESHLVGAVLGIMFGVGYLAYARLVTARVAA